MYNDVIIRNIYYDHNSARQQQGTYPHSTVCIPAWVKRLLFISSINLKCIYKKELLTKKKATISGYGCWADGDKCISRIINYYSASIYTCQYMSCHYKYFNTDTLFQLLLLSISNTFYIHKCKSPDNY